MSRRKLNIKEIVLPDGDKIGITYCDSAGPNSYLNLNSTSLFIRHNDGKWFTVGLTRSMHKSCQWIEICDSWKDVVEALEVDVTFSYGE